MYRVYKHSADCQTRLTTGLTTGCIMQTAGCQTGCTTRFDNRLNEEWLFVQHGCQTGCQTGLTTGLTIRLDVCLVTRYSRLSNRFPAVSCKRGITDVTCGQISMQRESAHSRSHRPLQRHKFPLYYVFRVFNSDLVFSHGGPSVTSSCFLLLP